MSCGPVVGVGSDVPDANVPGLLVVGLDQVAAAAFTVARAGINGYAGMLPTIIFDVFSLLC